MSLTVVRAALGAAFVLCLQIAPAQAQFATTFVSVAGSDSNTCARTTPCRTLAGALAKTTAGGKITVLDSGDFQSVSINKSVSIVAEGVDATVFTGTTTKITVDAGPNDVVYLVGLSIRRTPPVTVSGNSGIRFLGGRALHVRNCTIRGFGEAIRIDAPGPSEVIVSDSTIADNDYGVWARQMGNSGQTRVLLDRVTITRNALDGVRSARAKTLVRIGSSVITNNGTGIRSVNDGRLITFGDNVLIANGTDGTFTGKNSLK